MELRVSVKEDEHNSGFFRVKGNSANMVTANEDSDGESIIHLAGGSKEMHQTQFSFEDSSINTIFTLEDEALLNGVSD